MQVVVIGAGIGGLAAAAVLAHAGLDVTVLEAHVYPGGCAGTFYYQGYRFDAGATLAAGFYPGGPLDLLARAADLPPWEVHPADAAMRVHLPDGSRVTRWVDERRWDEQRAIFGLPADAFFRWQERTADALWNLALRLPPWPPQSLPELVCLAKTGISWLASGFPNRLPPASLPVDALSPLAAHLHGQSERLRLFADGQLLISAQAGSRRTNALYAAAALDLPRRGVAHLPGGMGNLAEALAAAIRRSGGRVLTRQEAVRIVVERGCPVAVETKRGDLFPAPIVVANLTPWDAARLLGDAAPPRLRRLPEIPPGWGAFMAYVGLEDAVVPGDFPLHHQVIAAEPLGEGNSAFLSLSPAWDARRAPPGSRALTISTHTALEPWRQLAVDPAGYASRKQAYLERLLATAETALPGLRQAARLVLPATPQTFRRFTRRTAGWVGGFPQTGLLRAWGPRLGENLWLVGDSIFPGQSVAAVALGGLRVATEILRQLG